MVITFHPLILRSEKNNAEQNAHGFFKEKNTIKMHFKIKEALSRGFRRFLV